MKKDKRKGGSTYFAPHLTHRNVLAGVEFYKAAFGAKELRRWTNADGSLHVAELSIDGAVFHLHDESTDGTTLSPETLKATTCPVELFVPDPAATMKRAVAAGGEEDKPVKDYDYGYRQGTLVDPAGHHWLIMKKIRVEAKKRAN